MTRRKCRCGHVYYADIKKCPICSNPDKLNQNTNEEVHDRTSEKAQDCLCYEPIKN